MNFLNCADFTVSIDRHKGLYGNRVRNFPEVYENSASRMDWAEDPYFRDKYQIKRVNLKAWLICIGVGLAFIKIREAQVSEYDRLKRYEQRAMQNKEAEQVNGKRARFVLFDSDGEQFTDEHLRQKETVYHVLWIDSKLKNYELCVDYFQKKQRITHASIQPILIVEKQSIMTRVLDIWNGEEKEKTQVGAQRVTVAKKEDKVKELYKILLKRDLTKDEKFARGALFEMQDESSEDIIYLEMKKNFFYVISPDGRVIDCAKIYSFLHENNIYQRIIAKIAQDLDQRLSKRN